MTDSYSDPLIDKMKKTFTEHDCLYSKILKDVPQVMILQR